MTEKRGRRGFGGFGADPAWLSVPAGLLAAGLILGTAPLATDANRILAITLFCIALWVGSPVEPWFTAVLGIGLIGVAFSTELALTGFQSPATWLVVVGILVGEAARESGLAGLVERLSLSRLPARAAGDALVTYRYLLVLLSFGSLALAVLVPSALVRVLVLAPILRSLGDLFDERRAKVGIFLGPLFATFYGASGVLTGSLANIIVTGLVESSGGPSITWTEWALWLGPVMGIGRVALVVAIAYVLYRPRDRDGVTSPERTGSVSTTPAERRMLLFLLLGVAVWATDAIHGLHPLFGAILVALLAFAPRIGVVGPDAVGEADFSIVFFLGAIFAIAEGLRRTDFTDLAANTLLSSLPADPSLPVVLAFVVVLSLALTLVMEGLAVASVLTPVLVSFAASTGVPLVPVAMIEAVALNAYFFPYQSAVLVAILGFDVVDSLELTRMASVCSVATLLLLVPIQIGLFAFLF
ncbi:SLC13 family permease [Halosimplex salinum]|uniref:SLC13 family permease n=1 Tax=Halosimplex salinum TaxID=1710538 RepID=UPI000F46BB4D|nr:SLC13 family permease [Halosimplex salinum]